MRPSFDAVLLIAFGGPTTADEIRPFLARVVRGHPVAPARIEEVVRHYEAVGGPSPLNEITFKQAKALEESLRQRGLRLPVYVGMRHASPFLRETLDRMTADGVRKALGFILSAHQTEASWDRYQQNLADAQTELGYAPDVEYCPGWHNHPVLIDAWAERVQTALEKVAGDERSATPVLFTAHSVPTEMAARSPYVGQIEETARLVAQRVGHSRWSVAYQSRSGGPDALWLEPDVRQVIRDLAAQAVKNIVVAPIGFVCDHVEVLYDLDIEARKIAEAQGMRFLRAASLNDSPTFIRMMTQVIEQGLSSRPSAIG